jgi:hypothetical protein
LGGSVSEKYYVRFRGRVLGPFDADKAAEMVRRGQITRVHELSPDGLAWRKADQFTELFPKKAVAIAVAEHEALDLDPVGLSFPTSGGRNAAGNGGAAMGAGGGAAQWFVHLDGQETGPVEQDLLAGWAKQGRVTPQTLVWKQGMGDWVPAETVLPDLFATRHRQADGDSHGSRMQSASGNGQIDSGLVQELTRGRGWALTVGIMLSILFAFNIIGAGILALIGLASMAQRVEGGANLLFSGLGNFVFSVLMLSLSIQVIRIGQAHGSLRNMPSVGNALVVAKRQSTFWMLSGIYLLLLIGLSVLAVIGVVLLAAAGR